MKKLFGILLIGLLTLQVSCMKGDELGDVFYYEFAEVTSVGESGYFEMKWDFGGHILRVTDNARPDHEVYVGERVCCRFAILREVRGTRAAADPGVKTYDVKLIDFAPVFSNEVYRMTEVNEKLILQNMIGNDGLYANTAKIAGYWLSIEFSVLSPATGGDYDINLIWDDIRSDEKTAYFILRHNALGNDSPSVVNKTGLASFNIKDCFDETSEGVKVVLEWEYYDVQNDRLVSAEPMTVGNFSYTRAAAGETVITEENRSYMGPPVDTSTFVR